MTVCLGVNNESLNIRSEEFLSQGMSFKILRLVVADPLELEKEVLTRHEPFACPTRYVPRASARVCFR